MGQDRIQTLHPDPRKSGPRIERWKYDVVREAILRAVPDRGDGTPFKELAGLVAALLPVEARKRLGSVPWYTTTVKLDLEARGEVVRLPGVRPQRLVRR